MDAVLSDLPPILALWLGVAAFRGLFVLYRKDPVGASADDLDDPVGVGIAALVGILWPLDLLRWLAALPGRAPARASGCPAPGPGPVRKRLKRARKGRKR